MAFRWTRQTRSLLSALMDGTSWRYGYDLSRETGLKSGTLYPLLMRLAERGWVEAKWVEPASPGRPPRHMYRLTAEGRKAALDALSAAAPTRREWRTA